MQPPSARYETPEAQTAFFDEFIEREIKRMRDEGPTVDELEKAKAFLKGSYALNFDTSTKIIGQLVQMQIDGLGADYVNRRNTLVEAVTIEDAKRAAHRLYKGGILVTVAGRPRGLNSSMPAKAPGGCWRMLGTFPTRSFTATRMNSCRGPEWRARSSGCNQR